MNASDPKVIEQFKNLPKKLKDTLFSEDTTEAVFAIGKENNLTVYQMGELADETGLIILGITRPEDYAKNVAQKLGTDPTATNKIVQSINQKIFDPIREDLRALHRVETSPQPPSFVRRGAEEISNIPMTSKNIETRIKKEETIPKPPIESIKPITPNPKETPPPANLPTIIQPIEKIAPPSPKPPSYETRDPYREPLDEEIASPFAKKPLISSPPPLPVKNEVISPLMRVEPPAPRPIVVTLPPNPVRDRERSQRPSVSNGAKPMSWEDVMAHPETQNKPATGSGKDAKATLEKMLNPDPYREPLK